VINLRRSGDLEIYRVISRSIYLVIFGLFVTFVMPFVPFVFQTRSSTPRTALPVARVRASA
jgi:hypothetical protein